MKKILFVFFIISALYTNAQSVRCFEGGFLMPAFAKEIPIQPVDLSNKYIGYADYAPFETVGVPVMSKNEAFNLAVLMIKAPTRWELRKDIGNFIRSSEGYISIFFSKTKGTWALNYHPGLNITVAGDKTMRFYCFR